MGIRTQYSHEIKEGISHESNLITNCKETSPTIIIYHNFNKGYMVN
jgi:hypothetical protein